MKLNKRKVIMAAAFMITVICVCAAIFIFTLQENEPSSASKRQTEASRINKAQITSYEWMKTGNIKDNLGNEYAPFSDESIITGLGKETYVAPIKNETETDTMWSEIGKKCGMYSLENDKNLETMMRIIPKCEWQCYYRKVDTAKIKLIFDNCCRFELIGYKEVNHSPFDAPNAQHAFCNDGIVKEQDVSAFIKDIKNAKTLEESGYSDRKFKKIYELGVVYGYINGIDSIAMEFIVYSYDDKKYTIELEDFGAGKTVVLDEKWIPLLQAKNLP